jgi:hypothetical protein
VGVGEGAPRLAGSYISIEGVLVREIKKLKRGGPFKLGSPLELGYFLLGAHSAVCCFRSRLPAPSPGDTRGDSQPLEESLIQPHPGAKTTGFGQRLSITQITRQRKNFPKKTQKGSRSPSKGGSASPAFRPSAGAGVLEIFEIGSKVLCF